MPTATFAPPDTDHLRENAPGLPDDVYSQRLAMLADYLESSGRHNQFAYVKGIPSAFSGERAGYLYADPRVLACAAGMAVLMFAHPDTELTAAGGVTFRQGQVIGTDRKAAYLLGITHECGFFLFAGCAPPDGVVAALRRLSRGENAGVYWAE